MTAASAAGRPASPGPWRWPADPGRYDTAPVLRAAERDAIIELGPASLRRLALHDPAARGWRQVRRLLRPLDDASSALDAPLTSHRRRAMLDATAVVLLRCAEAGRSYWAWTDEEWAGVLGQDQDGFRKAAPGWADDAVRPYLAAHAFLLGGFTSFYRLGSFSRLTLAWRVFGRDRVDGEIGRIRSVLAGWGYRLGRDDDQLLPMVACQVLLLNRSPRLEDLGTELFERVRRERLLPASRGNTLHAMQRAVAELGFCDPPQRLTGTHSARADGGPPAWKAQVERWHGTSALSPRVRASFRATLLKAGRWLEAEHPESADPVSWTRQTCAAWVAAVDRMNVGDYVQRTAGLKDQIGKPLEAATKAGHLAVLRTFFRDLQEWELVPRRFDPARALAVPRSIAALLGPDPRVIADDIWAKLMWAGLNLEARDLPQARAGDFYPIELVRAVTLAWLFSGQRSDEIARLRVGCVRWQHDGTAITGDSDQVLARDAVLPARRPHAQDRHRVHQARRPRPRPGTGRLAGRPPRPAEVHRPPHRRAGRPAVRLPGPEDLHLLHQQHGHPGALPQGRRSRRRRPGEHHQPPGPVHDRQPALQRQGTHDAVRIAGLARAPVSAVDPVLREDQPRDADPGLRRCGLLLPQRPHHRGPRRPRRRRLRRRRGRRALAALRPGPRLLHLHLLRAVPAPHGLREMRLLRPEGLQQGPAPRSEATPAEDAGGDPADRRRAGRRRRRQRRS